MRGADAGNLQTLLAAAGTWRTAALGKGVQLAQVSLTFADGRPVVLSWDPEGNDWVIAAGG